MFFPFDLQCFNYQLTNENFLICCGCYSEIVIYDMRTLEIKYTLTPSHVDANWISTFFVFQKTNAPGLVNEEKQFEICCFFYRCDYYDWFTR